MDQKHLVEAFGLRGALDLLRARHDQHLHTLGELLTSKNPRGIAQIGKAPVGAAAEEHIVDQYVLDGLAGLESHVVERLLEYRISL
jgi:hypothetical protein